MTVSTVDGRREIYDFLLEGYKDHIGLYGVFLCHHIVMLELMSVEMPLRPRIANFPELMQQKPTNKLSAEPWWPEGSTWERERALKQAIKLCS